MWLGVLLTVFHVSVPLSDADSPFLILKQWVKVWSLVPQLSISGAVACTVIILINWKLRLWAEKMP